MPPPDDAAKRVTRLLQRDEPGDRAEGGELFDAVSVELRQLAAGYLRRERVGHTLQPTALVNEAYIKLIDSTVLLRGDRERFLALAARVMRQVLVDFARTRKAQRRGGNQWQRVSLHAELVPAGSADGDVDLVGLDEALTRFATLHAKAAQVLELRFFGGLTLTETAAALDISERMVSKYWRGARAWLERELGPGSA